MRAPIFVAAVTAAAMLLAVPEIRADEALIIPGVPPIADIPNAQEKPDPNLEYKVLFAVNKAEAKPTEVNSGLRNVARFVNTLARYGVPADKRKIAVIISGSATPLVMKSDAYAARHDEAANPNSDLIRQLRAAGVDLRVCGQAARGHKIAPSDIAPEIALNLSGGQTRVNLQLRGYVLAGQ